MANAKKRNVLPKIRKDQKRKQKKTRISYTVIQTKKTPAKQNMTLYVFPVPRERSKERNAHRQKKTINTKGFSVQNRPS